MIERLGYGVNIVCDAGKYFAMGLAVKVVEGKTVDLLADFFSQRVGGLLSDSGHHPSLDIAEQGTCKVDQQEIPEDREDTGKVNRSLLGVFSGKPLRKQRSCAAEDLRTNDREDCGSDRKNTDEDQLEAVGLHVAEQPADRSSEVFGFFA